MSADPILHVHELSKSFGGLAAVDGATFDVARGSVTALIGPNGAGKTTAFNVISGFQAPDRGSIGFDGTDITGRAPHRIAGLGLVRTFQITKVLTKLSVLDNMRLAAADQPGERFWSVWLRPAAVAARERAVDARSRELLERVGLASMTDAYAGTLSGGQRKLLELARALMTEPSLVLLDEPLAGVNPTLGRRLLELIAELRRDQGITFLFIEHDMTVVMEHSDTVVVMADGRVIAQGAPTAVRDDPAVIDAYLGAST